VRYKYEDEAQKAVDRLDGRVVDGREIMVMISHLLFLTGVGWIATNFVACSFCSCGEHGKKMKSWAGLLTNS